MVFKNIKDAVQGKAPLGHRRSSHWSTVRKHHLKNNNIQCHHLDMLVYHG